MFLKPFKLKFAAAILSCLCLFLSSQALSQKIDDLPAVDPGAVGTRDPIFHDYASRGIQLVFNEQYEESLVIFNEVQQKYPDHPAPHFFKTAAYQIWMSNYRVKRFQKEVEENVQLAIDKGNKLLKLHEDPWVHFYVGGAYGYRAFNYFRKHDWISAYLDSRRGIKHLQKALELEPKLYDVYLATGTYYYWRTAKSKFLRVIAFWITDKRELGLLQLRFAIDHGQYAPTESAYGLIAAYFDYGNYQEAEHIYNLTIGKKKKFTVSDLYLKGRLLIQSGRWREAESFFREILQRLEGYPFVSVGFQVECKYWIAVTLEAQKRKYDALRVAEAALIQSEKRNVDSELEGGFENFEDVKYQLKDLRDELRRAG